MNKPACGNGETPPVVVVEGEGELEAFEAVQQSDELSADPSVPTAVPSQKLLTCPIRGPLYVYRLSHPRRP